MADEVGLYTPTVFEFFPAALCFRSDEDGAGDAQYVDFLGR